MAGWINRWKVQIFRLNSSWLAEEQVPGLQCSLVKKQIEKDTLAFFFFNKIRPVVKIHFELTFVSVFQWILEIQLGARKTYYIQFSNEGKTYPFHRLMVDRNKLIEKNSQTLSKLESCIKSLVHTYCIDNRNRTRRGKVLVPVGLFLWYKQIGRMLDYLMDHVNMSWCSTIKTFLIGESYINIYDLQLKCFQQITSMMQVAGIYIAVVL